MERKKFAIGVGDVLLLVGSALLLAGILTVFAPCGPKEDGSWMSCHWAGRAVAGLAGALCVLSCIHLLARNPKVKAGLDLAVFPVALLAAVLPGNLIDLCMMETMRCRTATQPFAMVLSVLVMAAAALDLILRREKKPA